MKCDSHYVSSEYSFPPHKNNYSTLTENHLLYLCIRGERERESSQTNKV